MRIAVLGAGGPAGVNTLRALKAAGHELLAFDENPAHLVWCEEYADTTTDRDFSGCDLVLAQPDSEVLWLADQDLPKFQPDKVTIQRCQDKHFAVREWHRATLRSGGQLIIEPWPDYLHLAQDIFGLPFWLRQTHGAGAKGAIKVNTLDEAYHWLRFWQIRGFEGEWMAEEFFPGADLAWTSIWYKGELVTSFLRQRLEYLYPHLTPEGLTGTPTIAEVVHHALANGQAEAAVKAMDLEPHGIFSVDLRENADGYPRPTEINAGRGFTTLGLWSLYGPNFLDIAVRLPDSLEEEPQYDALPAGLRLSRHIDCASVFVQGALV